MGNRPLPTTDEGLKGAATLSFREDLFTKARWSYVHVRGHPSIGLLAGHGERSVPRYAPPTAEEIYSFIHKLFVKTQLSAECSVVCLVYVERLLQVAKVQLLPENWRPIMLCGLLLASKVWQDLASWNIEFAAIAPRFPLASVNRLERLYLKLLRWDLYISQQQYAKYYFALRALNERRNFRHKYNTMVAKPQPQMPPNSKRVAESSKARKDAIYSSSM